MEDKPCCPSGAARKIKRLVVNGVPVGIAELDEVMERTRAKGLSSDEEIGGSLLSDVKIYNYVPMKRSSDYETALLEEYRRRARE